ncbi:hypothetical protein AU106_gp141 [Sinorhizobium phage phiM9]|uniref:Uncharacterized protein n=1 Tax=Sinorhizobium phage phiM9 TaxID=1636182 RepID=A0A0F6R519_9CAUD|nr:hypothetical protein AU106_gp141 [Sinorhizobium phage phiM9]AKE44772.1 hypothetical protein Sm_phiM9_144 [Sinorhizobium phage phiM9]
MDYTSPKLSYHISHQAAGSTITEVYIGKWYLGKLYQWPFCDPIRFRGIMFSEAGAISFAQDFNNLDEFEATLTEKLK